LRFWLTVFWPAEVDRLARDAAWQLRAISGQAAEASGSCDGFSRSASAPHSSAGEPELRAIFVPPRRAQALTSGAPGTSCSTVAQASLGLLLCLAAALAIFGTSQPEALRIRGFEYERLSRTALLPSTALRASTAELPVRALAFAYPHARQAPPSVESSIVATISATRREHPLPPCSEPVHHGWEQWCASAGGC